LVHICPVVLEKKVKMWIVHGQRRTMTDAKGSHCLWQGELKTIHFFCFVHTKYTRICFFEITLNMTQKVSLPSFTLQVHIQCKCWYNLIVEYWYLCVSYGHQ
jgi:hypothetical protein